MELSGRSIRLISRLFRRPFNVCAYRNVTGTAVKEEVNTELLNTFNQDLKTGGVVPVFRRALLFPSRVALQDDLGTYTYAGLFQSAAVLSNDIAMQLVGDTGRTIPYMCNNDASHVIVQWAIWMSGNIAVPLTRIHPPDMLKYYITDCMADLVICTQEYEKILRPLSLELSTPLLVTGKDKEITAQLYELDSSLVKPKTEGGLQDLDNGRTNAWYGNADAMIIYTSGTTSKPKGVVWSHNMLQTQISALHSAWQYSANDVVLHALPLHHIHGQLNSLNASLAAGSRLHMLSTFSPHVVWAQLVGLGAKEPGKVSVIHGVPAHYHRLVSEHGRLFADAKTREYVRTALTNRLRLAAVGSAPCPESLAHNWEQISGVPLLERYGMSEVGMALSNPYRPVEARSVGNVGVPLPGVTACVATVEEGRLRPLVTVASDLPNTQISLERLGLLPKGGEPDDSFDWKHPMVTEHELDESGVHQGELLLKGPAVFIRYWNRAPKLEDTDFIDGWFRTGDTASFTENRFKILGRTSVDIIKTGGYKISALQVESAILDHPSVSDVAVIGIDHEAMGEVVAAVVVLKENCRLTLRDIKEEAGKKLAPYQLPRKLILVDEMPRNAMGKLDKKEIRRLYGNKLRSERIVEK